MSDYGKSKMLCEKYLRKSKLKNVIIRPSLVVGEQMRTDSHFNVFTKLAIKRSLFCRIDWTGSMSVVDVKDLSKVIYFLSFKKFKNKSEIFMCSGKEICIGNFFDKINPKIFKIKISKFLKYFILRIGYVPFKLKCLLFRALVGSDKKINNFNIKLENKISQVFKKLELKEKYLSDPVKFGPPSGITIITGASSGIGREYLNYLIKTRNIIYAVDKNIDVLKNLKKKYKKKLVLKKIDLKNHQLLKDFLNNLLKKNILISEIFACAGIGKRGKITETEFEKHKEIFDLNVLSIIMLVRRALLNMSYLNYGNIVIISSSAAFQTLPNIASYAASKMAIKSLGEALVVENENKNINILNIFPGGAKTNFQKTAGVKVLKNEKLLTSEEIVVKSLFALRKKKSFLIISLKAKIMYLIGKLFPNVFLLKLYKLAMNKVR